MEDYIQVMTTTGEEADADRMADRLVGQDLAGCVQKLGPIESTYRWKDRIEKGEEWLCLIKTKASLYEEVEKVILEVHPYENPEIIATPISEGSSDYLNWLDNNLIDAI